MSEHKKRYWHVCQSCGQRFRSARSDTKYCPSTSRACSKYAQRQRRAEREVKQRADAELKARQAAEQQRVERARLEKMRAEQERAAQDARREAELVEQRRVYELDVRQWVTENTVIERCACGSTLWHVDPPGPLQRKLSLRCTKCGTRRDCPVTLPEHHCKVLSGQRYERWVINIVGDVKCPQCGQQIFNQGKSARPVKPASLADDYY